LSAFITTRGLSYSYETPAGAVEALKEVDLDIFSGEHIAIIGPNGSGKSTLLKHFNALLTPARGEVRVEGLSTDEAANVNSIRQTCGMVLQNPDNQLVATTVEEDVAFGPENLGLAPAEVRSRVDEALETVRIGYLTDAAPHLLSGGQKQKVAIAGILAMRPSCLLLDEPTSLLDPQGEQEVMSLVNRLNQEEGITVVHVTHTMEEAAQANRILVMNEGKIVHKGDPWEVLGQVDNLQKWNLEVPLIPLLVKKLQESGFQIPDGIIHLDELVDNLCL